MLTRCKKTVGVAHCRCNNNGDSCHMIGLQVTFANTLINCIVMKHVPAVRQTWPCACGRHGCLCHADSTLAPTYERRTVRGSRNSRGRGVSSHGTLHKHTVNIKYTITKHRPNYQSHSTSAAYDCTIDILTIRRTIQPRYRKRATK